MPLRKFGGTRVVRGSHRFLRSWHLPGVSDWESAVMPKGSAADAKVQADV